jgi:hypothetical protein
MTIDIECCRHADPDHWTVTTILRGPGGMRPTQFIAIESRIWL